MIWFSLLRFNILLVCDLKDFRKWSTIMEVYFLWHSSLFKPKGHMAVLNVDVTKQGVL